VIGASRRPGHFRARWAFAWTCFLASASTTRLAGASESLLSVVAVHQATLQGDAVRWDSQLVDCGADRSEQPTRMVTMSALRRKDQAIFLAPPVFGDEAIRIVLFTDPDLIFLPNDDIAAHRTRHGLELLHPAESSRVELLRCLHKRTIDLPPSALLLGRDPTVDIRGIEGKLVQRQTRGNGVVVVATGVFAIAMGGLSVAYRRLRYRVRLEAAKAILRADMQDL